MTSKFMPIDFERSRSKVKVTGVISSLFTFSTLTEKSFGPIFTKFEIYTLQMTGIMPITGLYDILNDVRTARARSWQFRENILFSTVF